MKRAGHNSRTQRKANAGESYATPTAAIAAARHGQARARKQGRGVYPYYIVWSTGKWKIGNMRAAESTPHYVVDAKGNVETSPGWRGSRSILMAPSEAINPRKRNGLYSMTSAMIGRPRVTYESWRRAGEARRIKALVGAGVPKKNAPAYAVMEWRDIQELDPAFISKLMTQLAKTYTKKNPKRKAKAMGRKTKSPTSTKRRAPKKAKRGKRKNPGILTLISNPAKAHRGVKRAAKTYKMFHGRRPKKVTTKTVPARGLARTSDYAKLGDLVELHVAAGVITFKPGEQPILATDAKATRLYLIGGNQDLSAVPATTEARGLRDLGEVKKIVYYSRKKFDDFRPIEYVHAFGEEGGQKPRLLHDEKRKQAMLHGGDYKIKNVGIVN